MQITSGSPRISIGIIDGPVDTDHPNFNASKIRAARDSDVTRCRNSDSVSCMHGTFITGILSGRRGVNAVGICPNCEIILRPIFKDSLASGNNKMQLPSSTPEELADAIVETVKAGARIINLSIGLSNSAIMKYQELQNAYNYAFRKGVIIVAAAGNQSNIGFSAILDHHWIIPVVACDENNRLVPTSNISPSIAKRGVMAPGVNITSTAPRAGYTKSTGTSFSAPFVTGAIALLWSLFEKATPDKLVLSVRNGSSNMRRSSIYPPLCNVERSRKLLQIELSS